METPLKSRLFRGLVLALVIALGGFGLAACGGGGHHELEGIVEGEPVALGDLEYNVLFTRPLNKNDVEDKEYLVGQSEVGAGETYIGVFLKIENLSEDESHQIPESFELVDTVGDRFQNIPSESIYALKPGIELGPEDVAPAIDSTPQVGPIQASMLLFKLPDEAMELRPVQLHIPGEDHDGEQVEATVDVDL